jgi:RimJ/RimL family protein N-acetyltransferase
MSLRLVASTAADYPLLGAAVWRGWAVPPGGLERPEVLAMLGPWVDGLRQAQGWGGWLALEAGEVVASVAVKAPVAAGMVEIGYGVAPARRGRGVATRMVLALLPVLAGHGVARVRAETAEDNPASARVLVKAGFRDVGRGISAEDGPVIWWEREP